MEFAKRGLSRDVVVTSTGAATARLIEIAPDFQIIKVVSILVKIFSTTKCKILTPSSQMYSDYLRPLRSLSSQILVSVTTKMSLGVFRLRVRLVVAFSAARSESALL